MSADREGLISAYVPNAVARQEQAITMAGALRLLDFSRETIVFELRAKYDYDEAEARRILREAVRRDPHPETPTRKKRIR